MPMFTDTPEWKKLHYNEFIHENTIHLQYSTATNHLLHFYKNKTSLSES